MKPVYLLVFVMFSLWDYYIPAAGGRVLDYIGLLILMASLMPHVAYADWRPLAFTRGHFLLLISMAPAIALGIVQGNILTAGAFLIGCAFVYALYFTYDIDYERLYRQIGWLIVVNLAAFYVQYATFQLTGYLINYHAWVGAADPRVIVGGVIRAAGFYQEPNGFCQTLVMLNAIRLFCPRVARDRLFPISLVNLILSESLWGIGAVIFLVLCRLYLYDTRGGRIPVFTLGLGSAALFAATLVDWPAVLELLFSSFTLSRVTDIANDPSAQARFSGAGGFALDVRFFIGHGVNINAYPDYLGVNAVSFYIYGFGLLGLLLFLYFLSRMAAGNALTKILIIFFAMTTYPLFTYAFWWAWLAVLVKASAEETVRAGQWHFLADDRRAYRPG